jgi:hypothetical protein
MDMLAVIGGGVLLVGGTAFALFLGIASDRIEHQREHDAGTSAAAH